MRRGNKFSKKEENRRSSSTSFHIERNLSVCRQKPCMASRPCAQCVRNLSRPDLSRREGHYSSRQGNKKTKEIETIKKQAASECENIEEIREFCFRKRKGSKKKKNIKWERGGGGERAKNENKTMGKRKFSVWNVVFLR
jgi:hypothetical protein